MYSHYAGVNPWYSCLNFEVACPPAFLFTVSIGRKLVHSSADAAIDVASRIGSDQLDGRYFQLGSSAEGKSMTHPTIIIVGA